MKTLAVDLGGTVIKAGLVADGAVVRSGQIEGRSALGLAQALPRLAGLMRELGVAEAGGVAIALPTLLDGRTGKVLMTMKGKYDGLTEFDLAGWCLRETGLPLRIENDAHAALLGEWRYGAGRGCDDLVMVTLGTGIGTSVLLGGKALRGRHAQAGNLGGHFVMDPNGFACVCGGRGCLEAQQHRVAINQLARADGRYSTSALEGIADISYGDLFRLAEGDELARALRDRSMALWGSMVVSLIHQFDCERVIVGGGVMKSAAVILPRLQGFADGACTPWGRVEVVAAELGDDAALLGLGSLFAQPPEYI